MGLGEKREENQIWELVLGFGAAGGGGLGVLRAPQIYQPRRARGRKGPCGKIAAISAPLGLCNQKARFEPRLANKSPSP